MPVRHRSLGEQRHQHGKVHKSNGQADGVQATRPASASRRANELVCPRLLENKRLADQ